MAPEASGRGKPLKVSVPSGRIELAFPVASDLFLVARLVMTSIASRSGFDIEEIEDLRLAIDELCLSVLGDRRGGRLMLEFDGMDDQIEVWCHHDGPEGPGPNHDDSDGLSDRMLDALVDEHGPATRDGRQGERMSKRRTPRDD